MLPCGFLLRESSNPSTNCCHHPNEAVEDVGVIKRSRAGFGMILDGHQRFVPERDAFDRLVVKVDVADEG